MAKHVAAAIVIMVLVVGCAPAPASPAIPATPTEVVEGCPLPCWEGITPGVTSSEDALVILHTAKYPVIVDRDWDRMTIQWSNWDKGYRAYLDVRDGIAASIFMYLDQGKMTVEDLLSIGGEPESVEVGLPESEGGAGCGLRLLYPALGTTAGLHALNEPGSIEASQSVTMLWLNSVGYTMETPIGVLIVPWKGYGNYCTSPGD